MNFTNHELFEAFFTICINYDRYKFRRDSSVFCLYYMNIFVYEYYSIREEGPISANQEKFSIIY